MIELNEEKRDKICFLLKKYDPDIVEITQFGSSVYAPQYARDLDLFLITKKKKEYGLYLDATVEIYDELDIPYNIDVVPHEIGEKIRKDFAMQVLGSSEVIYGDGSYLAEITKNFDPSYEEAKATLLEAKEDLKSALQRRDEERKDIKIRAAFNGLFHAARIAAMVYLSIENTRWGRIKRELPSLYKEEFRKIIDTLHIDYFYNGNYPENYDEEFEKWHKRVKDFVRKLEERRR